MLTIKRLTEPTLIIDEQKARSNINRMAEIAAKNSLNFRPHFKTHQSAVIGEWYKKAGVSGITVSSLRMAEYFARHGWNNITVAIPVNTLEAGLINKLASSVSLNLLVDSTIVVERLQNQLDCDCSLFIKIDTGYHRAGIPSHETERIRELILKIKGGEHTSFAGFLWHDGHTYHTRSKEEILTIRNQSVKLIAPLRQLAVDLDCDAIFSAGDTPSCSIASNYSGIDEIRPGNFIYYDLMQHQLGSCTFDQIAAAVFCPVLSVYPERNQILIHGGAVHFSKENLTGFKEYPVYGAVVLPNPDCTWNEPVKDAFLTGLSQEHGLITAPIEFVNTLKPGDMLGIVPVHSCLTVSCMQKFITTGGQQCTILQ
jgi:D-serine deaminase-like pyridoxal phosphate-dependent protein